jgi:hypothetical protein
MEKSVVLTIGLPDGRVSSSWQGLTARPHQVKSSIVVGIVIAALPNGVTICHPVWHRRLTIQPE